MPPLPTKLTLPSGSPRPRCSFSYFNRGLQSRVVLPEPSSPDISVSYNSASTGQLRLLREKPGILQKGVGSSIVRNLDTWDSLSEAFFQTNEVINSEFAGAARCFDAVRVVYEMDLGVGAFQQEVTASAAFVLCVQKNTPLDYFQLSNVSDFHW